MRHYYCQGDCKGMSYEIQPCEAEGCTMNGQPLTECNCEHPESHKEVHATAE